MVDEPQSHKSKAARSPCIMIMHRAESLSVCCIDHNHHHTHSSTSSASSKCVLTSTSSCGIRIHSPRHLLAFLLACVLTGKARPCCWFMLGARMLGTNIDTEHKNPCKQFSWHFALQNVTPLRLPPVGPRPSRCRRERRTVAAPRTGLWLYPLALGLPLSLS